MKKLFIKLGFNALKTVFSKRISDLVLKSIIIKTVCHAESLAQIYTDGNDENQEQFKDWLQANAKSLATTGNEALVELIRKNVDQNLQLVIIPFLQIIPNLVEVLTDDITENEKQVKGLFVKDASKIGKALTAFLAVMVDQKVEDHQVKMLIASLGTILERLIEIYTDDKPENKAQFEELMNGVGAEVIDKLSDIY